MKRILIGGIILTALILSNCQEQNSIEPITSKKLNKYTHTHIGPCVYCYTDSIGNPVAGAFVNIYQDSVFIVYLGQTDSTGWVHNEKDIMNEGWYTAIAETRQLYGEQLFYYDLDTLNHIYLEMFER